MMDKREVELWYSGRRPRTMRRNWKSTIKESLGIWESVCMESVVRNWRDPTSHRKVEKEHISQKDEIAALAGGSQRG